MNNSIGLENHKSVKLFAWIVCIFGALFYCYEYFLRITPSVMSQNLMSYYHLSATGFGNLSAYYYYAYTPMQLIVGLIMDRYKPRLVLTLACLSCAVGSYLFAASANVHVAEAGRFLIGFGSAFAFVGAMKLAAIWLPHQRFALFAGLITSLGMLGAMVGDISLTSLVVAKGWFVTVELSAAMGVLLACLLYIIIRDSNGETERDEADDRLPMKELFGRLWGFCKSKQMWIAGVIGCLLYVPLSAFAELWGVPFLEQGHGFSKQDAALGISIVFLGWAVGSPIAGWFSDYIKNRRLPLAIGSALSAIVAFLMIRDMSLTKTEIDLCLFLLGVFAGVEVIVFAVSRELSSTRSPATAIAFTNMVVMLGGPILQPVIGKLLDLGWSGGMDGSARVFALADYQRALMVIPIGMLAAMILSLLLRETHGNIEK